MMKTRVGIALPETPGKVTVKTVDLNLNFLQKIVGGYIEHVTLVRGELGMYVNDEGLLLDLPVNSIASKMYRGRIHGPAVFIGGPDEEGNETSIPEMVIGMWRSNGVEVIEES